MSGVTIAFPADQLKHIRFILLYLAAYNLLRKEGQIPALGIEDRIETEDLMTFHHHLANTLPEEPLPVTVEDVLYLYTCYNLSTQLLISQYDAQVYNSLFNQFPHYKEDNPLSQVRTIAVQNYLILAQHLETGFAYLKSLQSLKQSLQSFRIG